MLCWLVTTQYFSCRGLLVFIHLYQYCYSIMCIAHLTVVFSYTNDNKYYNQLHIITLM